MWPNPQETADLVTFTEEILNGKFYYLCSGYDTAKKGQASFTAGTIIKNSHL